MISEIICAPSLFRKLYAKYFLMFKNFDFDPTFSVPVVVVVTFKNLQTNNTISTRICDGSMNRYWNGLFLGYNNCVHAFRSIA